MLAKNDKTSGDRHGTLTEVPPSPTATEATPQVGTQPCSLSSLPALKAILAGNSQALNFRVTLFSF